MEGRGVNKRDFSLVELLITIIIISILTSMLLPVVHGAKNKAKDINCQSNLKQIGIAMQLYRDDNNMFFAPDQSYPFSEPTALTRSSTQLISAYMGNTWKNSTVFPGYKESYFLDTNYSDYHPFYCPKEIIYKYPSDWVLPLEDHASAAGVNPIDLAIVTYNINVCLGYQAWDDSTPWLRTKRTLTYPSSTFIYMDGHDTTYTYWGYGTGTESRPGIGDSVSARHSRNANMVMGDGHVEQKDYDELHTLFSSLIAEDSLRFHLYRTGGTTPYAR